jgi:outer membrane protein assembly factor BamB
MSDLMQRMLRTIIWLPVVAVLLLTVGPARALITRPTPLAEVLESSSAIVTAKVDSLDRDRPAMMLLVETVLKGKQDQKKLPVLLKGDSRAVKRKEPAQLLKRLAPKLPIVLFLRERADDRIAFAFSNGTWFSLTGAKVDGEVRWSLAHLEPYLRRTFAGTTADMEKTVRDALAGKRKPPPENLKEKPGLGPEVEEKKSGASAPYQEPARAVIPTVLVGGPLALLAMLFPTVFGGWKRWLVLLSTAGTTSTLFGLHWAYSDRLVGSWWGSPIALWAVTTALTVLGMAWAWQRHLLRVQACEAPALPAAVEVVILLGVGFGSMTAEGIARQWLGLQTPFEQWWPVYALTLAIWAGFAYVLWARWRGPRMTPAVSTEAVVLTALAVVSIFAGAELTQRGSAGGLEAGEVAEETSVRRVWTFRLPSKGAISSSPLLVGDHLYVAAAHDDVFRPFGAVYCLQRATGNVLWTFDDKRKMKQVFSSPVVVGDRLYIGEGFHQDAECRVLCLSAQSGKKLWEHPVDSHTESTPCVVNGRVYCGAGDDGLLCLNADTGEKVWGFPSFHIDTTPVVRGGSVYVGCGIGDTFRETALFSLDAGKGKPRWRYPTDLPVWSRPVVAGGFVYAGIGNGRLNESDDRPAGAVLCLREKDGEEVWKRRLSDGVLGRLEADRRHLFFGCRDGSFYCLRRSDGAQVWRRGMGSPVVAGPAVQVHPSGEAPAERLYAASLGGYLACLEPATGKLIWGRDLADRSKAGVELIATPALEVQPESDGRKMRRLYVALTLLSSARVGEVRCYEETAAAKE